MDGCPLSQLAYRLAINQLRNACTSSIHALVLSTSAGDGQPSPLGGGTSPFPARMILAAFSGLR